MTTTNHAPEADTQPSVAQRIASKHFPPQIDLDEVDKLIGKQRRLIEQWQAAYEELAQYCDALAAESAILKEQRTPPKSEPPAPPPNGKKERTADTPAGTVTHP